MRETINGVTYRPCKPEDLLTHREFYVLRDRNASGDPARWRANGVVQTWKTRPDDIRLPVKHGLYAYDYIEHLPSGRTESKTIRINPYTHNRMSMGYGFSNLEEIWVVAD